MNDSKVINTWIAQYMPVGSAQSIAPFDRPGARRFRVVCQGVTPLLLNGTEVVNKRLEEERAPPTYQSMRPDLDEPIRTAFNKLTAAREGKVEKDLPQAERLKIRELRAELNRLRGLKAQALCETKLYRDGSGKLGIPKDMLLACLCEAGREIKLDKFSKLSTAKQTAMHLAMEVLGDDTIALTGPGEWVVDMRVGKDQESKEQVLVHRPRFDEWGFAVEVAITDELIAVSDAAIRELFTIAGVQKGLGAFRPGLFRSQHANAALERAKGNRLYPPGHFGKYAVVEWVKVS